MSASSLPRRGRRPRRPVLRAITSITAAAAVVVVVLALSGSGVDDELESDGSARVQPQMPAKLEGVRRAVPRGESFATPRSLPGAGAESVGAPEHPSEQAIPSWALDALGYEPGDRARLRSNLQPMGRGRDLRSVDLAVLAEIIREAGLDESSSPFDYDDGDGVFEPWELGYQVWQDGALLLLALGPSPRFSFGYRLDSLPPSLGDLTGIEVLDLHGSRIEEIPESIGRLRTLRQLRLDDNRLSILPVSIGDLYALDDLNVRGNQLHCEVDAPTRSVRGSAASVVGLAAQRCP